MTVCACCFPVLCDLVGFTGSGLLSQRLAAAGIRHRYEEFDDEHSDIDYRMDVSLPFLYRALR